MLSLPFGLCSVLSADMINYCVSLIRIRPNRTHRSQLALAEKKFERAHCILGSASSTPKYSSSSLIDELDALIREIMNPAIFESHQQGFSPPLKSEDGMKNDASKPRSLRQPFKKIRQSSPSRKIPQGLSALDGLIHHKRHSNQEKRAHSLREKQLERVMWESAAMLSNSHPSPNFVVDRKERTRREEMLNSDVQVSLKSEEVETGTVEDQTGNNRSASPSPIPPLFEGSIANATPGDLHDGGTGSGTAQHLACLLDSPLALVILIVMGINVDSRHTAFRRLAMHEAACADSPKCLSLLMGAATKFSQEEADGIEKETSLLRVGASSSFAAAAIAGFDSSAQDNVSPSISVPDSPRSGGRMKLPFFSGWGDKSSHQKSPKDSTECGDSIAFPEALKIVWDVVKMVTLGEMNEEAAAQHILDQIGVSTRTKTALSLQIGLSSGHADVKKTSALYLYGLTRRLPQPRIPNNIDGHGNTPLHWASFKNSVRAIDILLSYNVDVNFPAQPSGWTPLHDAAYSDSAGAVKRLIAAGASVNARSHSGATPLCFAAQEDASNATKLLLKAGADPAIRCLGHIPGMNVRANNADNNIFHSRFSGYTPLHYCAHYNSSKSAKVLLDHRGDGSGKQLAGVELLEIPDLNEKLPIHVAVARGSSEVLRELLHGGARVETASYHPPLPPRVRRVVAQVTSPSTGSTSIAIPVSLAASTETPTPNVVTPVSSPVLRSMLPSEPVSSSKPWNCLSQKSIDACRSLIEEVEQNWTPARHALFSPTDRVAVKEVLRVGKRLEQNGSGVILEIWPYILSFCGRGWFEVVLEDDHFEPDAHIASLEHAITNEDEIMQTSSSDDSSMDDIQFDLDEAHDNVTA